MSSIQSLIEEMCADRNMEIAILPARSSLSDLLSKITVLNCTATELLEELQRETIEHAEKILTNTLHRSLAYPSVSYRTLERASVLARQFLSQFGTNLRVYSNGSESSSPRGWMSLTAYTFEQELYVFGDLLCGLLVVVEDD